MANIVSAGDSLDTSSDVVLADGASANLVLMVASGTIPANAEAVVYVDSSGIDIEVARMGNANRAIQVRGPGTFRVTRLPGATFGVDSL